MTLLDVPFSLLLNPIDIPSTKGVLHVLLLILNPVSTQGTPHLCVVANPVTAFTRAK